MSSPSYTWVYFIVGLLFLSLSACKKDTGNNNSLSATEVLPPASPDSPSRPSQPAPVAPTQQPVRTTNVAAHFAPQPAFEKLVAAAIKTSLFQFNFESPTEMAAPRQLLFSGTLESPLSVEDLPIFSLQLYNNSSTYENTATTVYTAPLPLVKETQDTYSFQLTTADALQPGLYYYLIKNDNGRLCYAGKVIVDY